MKSITTFLLIISLFAFSSCKKDDDKIENANVTFEFSFNWDGTPITVSDFNEIKFTNQNGQELSIEKLRYLVSNFSFHNGATVENLGEYNLVDLTNSTGLSFTPQSNLPTEDYDKITFNFGFNPLDNDQVYTDLNTVSWNWPDMLGGGYHFMQFEGKYLDTNNETQSFAYHNGTARVSEGVFEDNHFEASIDGFDLNDNATIEIKMNIAEWFKDPNEWNLNELNTVLMPNYNAQKMMQANGASVFSLGTVTQ